MKDNYLVGIDVGTKKICTLIAQVKCENQQESIEIVGYGLAESRGLRKGMVTSVGEVVNDIRKSVKEAEMFAGLEVESAFVNISGRHIQSINAKGNINISTRSKEIEQEDLERAIRHASTIQLSSDRVILHTLPQEFIVNDQEGIKNPIGLIGSNLEVLVHIITCSQSSYSNLKHSLKKAKIEVEGIALSHIASSEAVLTDDEKDLGVLVIDIGGGKTDFSIYEKGFLAYVSSIPYGGENFTNDLAIGIRTSSEKAEKIKKRHGITTDLSMLEETIEVPTVSGSKQRPISLSVINDILKPRAEEILELIKNQIEKEHRLNTINSGVVLCGGGAMLKGIVEIAEDVFSLPVRLGIPYGVGGLIDKVNTPDFATAVGLVKYAYSEMKNSGKIKQKKGMMEKFIDFFRP